MNKYLGKEHQGEIRTNMRITNKPVNCVTTGETFRNAKAAAIKYGLSPQAVFQVCNGLRSGSGYLNSKTGVVIKGIRARSILTTDLVRLKWSYAE